MALQYPSILDFENSPFFKITCYDWKVRGKKDQNSRTTDTILETIFLPISKNGVSESIINNWDISDNITKDSVSDFAKSFVGQKVSGVLPGVTKYLSYNTGQILNDFSALTFSGNNFREFNLSYDLYPSSADEYKTIKEIVDFFKRNSLPEYEGFKINYPRFWNLEMIIPNGESPVKFNNCALVDMTDEYFQGENITVYNDGGVNVSISLNFRELRRIGRSDI